jgi:hypothetical protein
VDLVVAVHIIYFLVVLAIRQQYRLHKEIMEAMQPILTTVVAVAEPVLLDQMEMVLVVVLVETELHQQFLAHQ